MAEAVNTQKEISIHALREEGDSCICYDELYKLQFLSTPSARRATRRSKHPSCGLMNFYPRPPRGGRRLGTSGSRFSKSNFYPRPPRGGRQILYCSMRSNTSFLSTPSARRATAYSKGAKVSHKISIHALREEGDYITCLSWKKGMAFLSTPSARRATWTPCHTMSQSPVFLSTPSARRATNASGFLWPWMWNFYPRPPRGGRRGSGSSFTRKALFLSTPSARRATIKEVITDGSRNISIHALREEGDKDQRSSLTGLSYFYPRPPRGGRPG